MSIHARTIIPAVSDKLSGAANLVSEYVVMLASQREFDAAQAKLVIDAYKRRLIEAAKAEILNGDLRMRQQDADAFIKSVEMVIGSFEETIDFVRKEAEHALAARDTNVQSKLDQLGDYLNKATSRVMGIVSGREEPKQIEAVDAPESPSEEGPRESSKAGLFTSAANIKSKPMSWLWNGVIPRGVLSLLSGPPGAGKSTLAMMLAAHVSTGRDWPDGSPCPKGGVIVCEMEDLLEETTLPRLQAAGADMARVCFGSHCDLTQDDTIAALDSAIMENKAILVLFSPIRVFFGPSETNNNAQARTRLQKVESLAQRRGFALLGITHPVGGGKAFGGSRAWLEVARGGLNCEPEGDGGYLTALKTSLAPKGWGMRYRLKGTELGVARVAWGGEEGESEEGDQTPVFEASRFAERSSQPDQPAAGPTARLWLLDHLRGGEWKQRSSIMSEAEQAGFAGKAISRAQGLLTADGLVEHRREYEGGPSQWRLAGGDPTPPHPTPPRVA